MSKMNLRPTLSKLKYHKFFILFLVILIIVKFQYMEESICTNPDQVIYLIVGMDFSDNLILDSPPKTLLINTNKGVNSQMYFGRPPLIPLIIGILIRLFNVDEYLLRILFLFISTLSVILLYHLSSILYNRRIGLISSFFLGLSPLHLYYGSGLMMLDIPLMLCFLITVIICYKAIQKDSILLYSLSGVMIIVAFLTKYPGAVLYPILFLIILFCTKWGLKKKILTIGIIFLSSLITLTPYLIYNAYFYGDLLGSFSIEFNPAYRHLSNLDLNQKTKSFLAFNIFKLNRYISFGEWSGIPIFIFAVFGFLNIIKNKKRYSKSNGFVLIPLCITLIIFHLMDYNFRERYLFPLLPFLSILAAIGSYSVCRKFKNKCYPLNNFRYPCFFMMAVILYLLIFFVYHSVFQLEGMKKHFLDRKDLCEFYKILGLELQGISTPNDVISYFPPRSTRYMTLLSNRTYTDSSLLINDEKFINYTVCDWNVSIFVIDNFNFNTTAFQKKIDYLTNNTRMAKIGEIEYKDYRAVIFGLNDSSSPIYV